MKNSRHLTINTDANIGVGGNISTWIKGLPLFSKSYVGKKETTHSTLHLSGWENHQLPHRTLTAPAPPTTIHREREMQTLVCHYLVNI